MHEAGLAAAAAAAVRRAGRDRSDQPIRLVVRGGHADPEAFDAALRLHLAGELPGIDADSITIEHAPHETLCAACGSAFQTDHPAGTCPHCGGPGLPVIRPETIALECEAAPCA
jgi:Zn finger protein HypA/HybF involved in hydrogenase expression